MSIPTYDMLMLPVLQYSAGKPWLMRDLVSRIADDLMPSNEERSQRMPSGGTRLISNRVHWAKTYLKQAGLVEPPKRGIVQISVRGQGLLNNEPAKIDVVMLQNFPEFRSFMTRTKSADGTSAELSLSAAVVAEPANTSEEQIGSASRTLDEALRDALMARILEGSPDFFEELIVDLLLAMAYGGSKVDAGEQLGGTGDSGIDGVIREDQ